ncbi:MAG: SDR family oxidoreductase [Gammaproteobacteria bacterium]|nr:SDR family oxidoreductase [Gammaproteobacteria bacterium]
MTTRTALISCVGRYMGPAIKEKFESLGITVVSGGYPMTTQTDCEELVSAAGQVDILIANLAEPPMTGPVQDIENADWNKLFDSLVHPLMYLIRAVTPQMLDRQAGKIIAVTSAAPLKGIANNTAYCAARGAQNGFIKAVGLELARSNIQVNAIAQNYINNNTYYPDDILDNEKFLDHVKRNVPTNKVGAANETAQLAAYLAREDCRHMVGQVIPLAGGWVT